MQMLELGCGVGEVSLLAARLVGLHDRVTCLDFDPTRLQIARGRVPSAGQDHVSFEQVDVNDHSPLRPLGWGGACTRELPNMHGVEQKRPNLSARAFCFS